jgi:hypothetical protein
MKNKKRLALEIGLVGVIIYLWLKRCKKNNAIAEAKEGANVAPTTEATSQTGECGSISSDCMGTDTSKKSQLEKTITVDESTANFSGTGKGIKAQYFR